ncbi:MAG: TlpA family protein disulfide reductase [Saprospiraceae bacterium]|nr:TlpA family protein disulfide reductase [Saprospiraceae bacterium]MCB9321541.1 TlpA family protein disulfide reductase [Lewinellaceae bacterium]
MRFIRFLGILILILGLYWLAKYLYFKPKYKAGIDAPGFEFVNLAGETKKLSDFQGQYVLIDFWASWCGPCRAQNPKIRELYAKYHHAAFKDGSGFEVINIAIEGDPERWKQAINQDGLDWPNHFTDGENFQGPVAKRYGIRQIPTSYLVNPSGKIVAVNPDIEFISTFFDRRMTS